jgi:hypothetical protein
MTMWMYMTLWCNKLIPFYVIIRALCDDVHLCNRCVREFWSWHVHSSHSVYLPKPGVTHVTHSENGSRGAYKHEFLPLEPFLHFSQRTCPIHYFRSKTHVWGGFAQFRCLTSPIPKTGVGVHTNTSLRHRNHFFVFRNERAQSSTLGPKLMFGVVSRNFVATRHPFR